VESASNKPAQAETASNTSSSNQPSADAPAAKAQSRLKLPDIFQEKHTSRRSNEEEILSMKTGDRCYGASHCTGGSTSLTEDNEPTGREVCCTNSVVNASNTTRIETGPPRKKSLWKNCAALADGRNGEKCEGTFACFKKATDKRCIERVACGESTFGADKLLRYLVCDDISSTPSTTAAPSIYTNCADARDAKPLDRCSGEFLCEITNEADNSMRELTPCANQKGYCPAEWEYSWNSLLYCDGETIHLFTFGMRV
jgi:hypothetical protein